MKKLIFLLVVIPVSLFAQNRVSTCYFGNVIMDFRTDPPTILSTGVADAKESPASICDANGDLLFYSNGGKPGGYPGATGIWNAQQQLIDGEQLIDSAGCYSSYSGATIVPLPTGLKSLGDRYYLLMKDCIESNFVGGQYNSGFTYALVDMALNGGAGGIVEKYDVVVPYSVVSAHATAYEPITAFLHGNGLDYWVFSYTNDSLYRIRLSENGFEDFQMLLPAEGKITVSPARNYLSSKNIIYTLDPLTGDLVLKATLPEEVHQVVFSPAGNLAYANVDGQLFQYQLNVPDVLSTGLLLGTVAANSVLVLAPNYRIYIFEYSQDHFRGQIVCPNTAGSQCGLELAPISLGGGYISSQFTNLPAHYLYQELANCFAATDETAFAGMTIFPNPNETGIFQLESDVEIEDATVFDPAGKVILSQKITGGKAAIDLSRFPAGIYLLQLRNGKDTAYRKLVIME